VAVIWALDPVRHASESRTPTERWAFAGAEFGARREQLVEEPIESGADKTDETILKHLSAVQRRGYTLGESTQVGEKRIDLSTLEND
jgi:hypothetical protein